MIIATAGHVDHGKTALVKALTGVHTDRLAEEARRGLTIDLGFAYVDWQGQRWGLIDVPGHQRFIGNMLAGVAAIDAALLVVAADSGPQPQTLEHLAILQALGVDQAVVALTRADVASAEQRLQAAQETRALLAGSALADAPCIPVSAITGDGIDALQQALLSLQPRARQSREAGFRLCIDRAFHVTGTGLVVTGTAHAGRVRNDDELVLLPASKRVRVRSLRALDQAAEQGMAGQRLALNLTGCERSDVHRGSWLASVSIARTSVRLDAALQPLGTTELKHGQEVHIHHGASHTLGRLSRLHEDLWHVATREPLAVLHGDRFIVRDSSARTTLAGGRVLDPEPPVRGRRKAGRRAQLQALLQPEPAAIIEQLLRLSPLELDLEDWAARLNRPVQVLLPAADTIVRDGPLIRSATAWQDLQQALRDTLARYHAGNPQLAGMGVAQLRAVLEPRPAPSTLNAALAAAIRNGLLARTATHFHLPGHQPRLQPGDQAQWQRVQPHLEKRPLQPPVVHELARNLDMAAEELTLLLIRAHHAGHVVRVADNRFLLPAAVSELAAVAAGVAAAAADGRFDARSFRDAAGIGRNLAIDLLEYFDRAGLTRRFGNHRVLVANPDMFLSG